MFSFNRREDPDANEKPSLLSNFTFTTWLSNNTTKPESNNSTSSAPNSRAWIKGVIICSWVIATVLTINIVLTIIAVGIAYSKNDEKDIPFAALYTGKCSTAKNWTTGLHLIINILSTVLLGASNYCMQCLASPSRAQVDTAHTGEKAAARVDLTGYITAYSFDVGLKAIDIVYNSAVFYSIGSTDYTVVVAPPGPMNGTGSAGWNRCFEDGAGLDIETVRSEMSRSDLKRLSVKDCIDTFAQDYVSGQRMLVLVTDDPIPDGEPLAFMGMATPFGIGDDGSTFEWMCDGNFCSKDIVNEMVNGEKWTVKPLGPSSPSWVDMQIPTENGLQNISWSSRVDQHNLSHMPDMRRLDEILHQIRYQVEVEAALDDPSNWTNASFPGNVTVFSFPKDESCRLMFSLPICVIVIGCNLIKLICALLTARDGREDLFLTIGDAIASYLACPDPRTEGGCLLSKQLVVKGSQGWRRKAKRKDKTLDIPVYSKLPLALPSRKRWFQAVSTVLWISTITLFVAIIAPSIFALRFAMGWFSDLARATIWDNSLGEARPSTLISIPAPSGAMGTFAMMLVPNVIQLFVSIAYFILNALLTAMLGAMEYNNYARNRKPLRVSWPRGTQRSTYYLSLPYRYSFPLLVASATLHWLVSQSLFFVQITPFDINGQLRYGVEISTCGYSPLAIMLAIIVGGLLLLVPILLSLRRFESPIPLAVQCSAAISAACHPMTSSMDDTANHALKPVQWGEIPGIYADRDLMAFSHRIDGDENASGIGRGNEELHPTLPNADPNDLTRTGAAIPQLYHCTLTSEDVSEPRKGRVYI
ncbi:hypothetical protein N7463_005474 [Penicillium fimorum]|uniref:DUF6536 domain-containing protein n=1 Tax=Penicillium fimorum TaxID=1882269 RepID=A0A9W9XSK8_9EURO|nr:hypothetical protein N7463_005474 [Penicillium fimorum]